MEGHTILLVDDEKNILSALNRLLRKEGYNILTAEGGGEGLEIIRNNRISVVVSDHRMPGMEGAEFLSKVKEVSPETIRLMLTGYADIKVVMAAINKGEVYRYITKPWNDDELKHTVKDSADLYDLIKENKRLNEVTKRQNAELTELNRNLEARVIEKTRKISENFFAFIRICADLMELYDPQIGGHSKRVASMARGVALKMRFDEIDADLIESAALLHNIGLIGIPRDIVDKDESELNENEKALLMHNPILSQDLLLSIDSLRQVGVIIRSHMERYDGKGYPDGLKKSEIHVGAGIISVCKLYDNLLRNKKHLLVVDVIERIKEGRGTVFDPEVVDAFIEFLPEWKEETAHTAVTVPGIISLYDILDIADVRSGMALANDITTVKGRLLVTKGTVLSQALIGKILSFHRLEPIAGNIKVISSAELDSFKRR